MHSPVSRADPNKPAVSKAIYAIADVIYFDRPGAEAPVRPEARIRRTHARRTRGGGYKWAMRRRLNTAPDG